MPAARRLALALLLCAGGTSSHAFAIGRPLGRSLRQPAAWHGVVCMKGGAAATEAPPAKKKRPRLPRSRSGARRIAVQTWDIPHDSPVFDVAVNAAVEGVAGGLSASEEAAFLASRLTASSYPALVLNADFRPLSYLPLSVMSWQDSIKAICRDTVQVLATYDRTVRSPSMEIALPSVLVLKQYRQTSCKETPLTRRNLFLRDNFECQYCGGAFPVGKLTYDHIHPRALGGKTTWTNTVTACGPCNSKKGSRLLKDLPDMKLRSEPRMPKWSTLQAGCKAFPPKKMHPSWHSFFF